MTILSAVFTAMAGLVAVQENLIRGFHSVPEDCRLRMHWFVFGPAWDEEEALRQLRGMHEQHVGGVLIFPTYPMAIDDQELGIHNQRYLDADFFRVLNAVLEEADRLSMTVDLVIGTGWPFGGPSVAQSDAAQALRMRAGTGAALQRGETLVAVAGEGDDAQLFYSVPTNMQVKRPALGGEGLVLDHYDSEALQRYLDAVAVPLLEGTPRGALRAFFCDSLEVYESNWTTRMPQVFRERCGYDLIPHLPALFDSNHSDSRDVRYDFWRTCSEQVVEGFVKPLHEWTRQHGVELQLQAYGTPPVSLTAYQFVDQPVGEHYEWMEFCSSRWASSGGHIAGKNVILAEAWTWLGLPDRFSDSLQALKVCSDLHFLCGINALYGVSYAYSPLSLGAPGWPPYFGPVVNHTQPYWPYFSEFADTVNRSTFLLQQGRPVADVALYLPVEDCMADASPEQLLLNWAVRDRLSSNGSPPEFQLQNALHYRSDVITTLVASGYSFDGVDRFAFHDARLRSRVKDYSALVLPNLTAIDVEALEQITQFVREGGLLVATSRLPETSWGMLDRDAHRQRVQELVQELFADPKGTYGKGRAILAKDEKEALRMALSSIPPDLQVQESAPLVGFVHRRGEDFELYFLANPSADAVALEASFRSAYTHASRFHLVNATIEEVSRTMDGRKWRIPLAPWDSCAIVLTKERLPVERRFVVRTNGKHEVRFAEESFTWDISDLPAPQLVTPPWRVSFGGSSDPMELRSLVSWTELPMRRFYSGITTYEAKFELAESLALAASRGALLDLGRVHETADVFVNGQRAGTLWMEPFEIEVSRFLRPGTNELRIEVSNLLINQVLGEGPPDHSKLHQRYGRRFPDGEEWNDARDPRVSGLLGPVRLVFTRDLLKR